MAGSCGLLLIDKFEAVLKVPRGDVAISGATAGGETALLGTPEGVLSITSGDAIEAGEAAIGGTTTLQPKFEGVLCITSGEVVDITGDTAIGGGLNYFWYLGFVSICWLNNEFERFINIFKY